jgi:hypothetical protein
MLLRVCVHLPLILHHKLINYRQTFSHNVSLCGLGALGFANFSVWLFGAFGEARAGGNEEVGVFGAENTG